MRVADQVPRTAVFAKLMLVLSLFAPAGCAPLSAARDTRTATPSPSSSALDVARARGKKRHAQAFPWAPWSKETFDRARREGRYILFHGAAAWCHWCHVMEETTYRDPEVGRILRERFIAIRVDVDSRPDIEERYGEWGWPATILFSPDAEEVGKFRGYLPPEELREILARVDKSVLAAGEDRRDEEPGSKSAPIEALSWVGFSVRHAMHFYYDDRQGGWGVKQKAPLGENAEFEVRVARRGDHAARERVVFSLRKQRSLIDPVWGGIYQYSTGGTWRHPHFEKLMTYQAPNLEAYARAYELTRAPEFRRDAERIASYVDRFLTRKDGAFFTNQDADVGAHDPRARFVDGNVYYKKSERERLALGVPWIDKHVYAYENGLMIAALVTLHEVTSDARYIERARRAANTLLKTHVDEQASVQHDAQKSTSVRYLADAASLARALARLAEATGEARYRDAATRVTTRMIETLEDPATGAFWAHTVDPDAAGVFAERRHPFTHNVLAARALSSVAKLSNDARLTGRARRVLAALATPAAIDQQGRMVGGYLLALDEAGAFPW